jgi:anti-sigma factor RsiW
MSRLPIDDKLLVAYADGELDPGTAAALEARLAEDTALAERLAMFRRTAELIRAALCDGPYAELPQPVAERARRLIDGRAVDPRAVARRAVPGRSLPRRTVMPVAAGLLGLALGIGVTWLADPRPFAPQGADTITAVLRDVAEYHAVFAAEHEHLVEIPAARSAELESWLGQRVGLHFRVPDLAGRGLAFAGGRMLVVDGRPVAQLMYTAPSGARVALCFTAAGDGPADGAADSSIEQDGVRLVGRRQGGHLFIVAGPAGDRDLDGLARDLPTLLSRS